MHRRLSVHAPKRTPAKFAVRSLLALLFAGLLIVLVSAGAFGNPPAAHAPASPAHSQRNAPANASTPPAIKGRWPTFSISGTFDPKQVTNPKVTAFWIVDTRGRATAIHLDKSSGSKPVDNAILHYVRSLHFTPATLHGKPVTAHMSLPFELATRKG